jgi:A/G-specific adenine glycosylase
MVNPKQVYSMNKQEQAFVETVWQQYRERGRHDLPWRQTTNPYKILVSEVMLQQTQVERVIGKYQAFIATFPSVKRLAAASLGDVLKLWQGLGYNRRAKFLHAAAVAVVSEYGGMFPKDVQGLQRLPGVGPYTAGAVAAFAYNEPVVMIETNIRQVYLHHFFSKRNEVHDADILQLVERTVSLDTPREWYWALMDYGSYLKRQHGNINQKSKHYTKQSKFAGSDRQIRGAIVKLLTQEAQPLTVGMVQKRLTAFAALRVAEQLAELQTEGMIVKVGFRYQLI